MTPYHRMQAGLALVAISLVSLWALFATMHLQYHLVVAWSLSPASTVIHADKSPVAASPLDLNAPATSQQLAALLYTLVSRDGDDPAQHGRLAVILPGDDAVNVTMVPLAIMRAELRSAFLVRLVGGLGVFGLLALLFRRYQIRRVSAPLGALVDSLNSFSVDPSVATPIPAMVSRAPEFIEAANALEALQRNTLLALRQRERLADIGEAVAKINHDIRNVLSSATLVADTLLASKDERVRRMAPHIVRSLEQSVDLCQSMLDYLAEAPLPEPVRFAPAELVAETSESASIPIRYSGPDEVRMDRTMLSRILLNLARNAVSAGAQELSVDIWRAGKLAVIDIADDGPGIPQKHWDDLFLAFRSKQRGGSGLGLAIARDLAVAQGGNLKLARSNDDGSEFRLQLPLQVLGITDDED
jgi:signal transduction histidine kinase